MQRDCLDIGKYSEFSIPVRHHLCYLETLKIQVFRWLALVTPRPYFSLVKFFTHLPSMSSFYLLICNFFCSFFLYFVIFNRYYSFSFFPSVTLPSLSETFSLSISLLRLLKHIWIFPLNFSFRFSRSFDRFVFFFSFEFFHLHSPSVRFFLFFDAHFFSPTTYSFFCM